jgi:hypothetical protein
MSFQRSKSIPDPSPTLLINSEAESLLTISQRSVSQHHLSIKTSLQPLDYYGQIYTKLKRLRGEWENPFSLKGFFSPSQDDKEWVWLHEGEGEEQDKASESAEEEKESTQLAHNEARGPSGQEDKNKAGTVVDDGVLLSPYAHELVNEEPLYHSLCALRVQHEHRRVNEKGTDDVAEFPAGGLFFSVL